VVGLYPGMGCMVPQPLAVGGNRSYLEFWTVTGDPRYPRYLTPIIVFSFELLYVLAICDFDMRYIFVVAGWSGSVHDTRILNHALINFGNDFPTPL
jgi:hypothetical protein